MEEAGATIDALLLTGPQNVCFNVFDFMGFLTCVFKFCGQAQGTQTREYKEWAHYARSGGIIAFYQSAENHRRHVKEMVPFFRRMQLMKCHLLKLCRFHLTVYVMSNWFSNKPNKTKENQVGKVDTKCCE